MHPSKGEKRGKKKIGQREGGGAVETGDPMQHGTHKYPAMKNREQKGKSPARVGLQDASFKGDKADKKKTGQRGVAGGR